MTWQDYMEGKWVDSSGAVNPVRFKKIWGTHLFSEEEKNILLEGNDVEFPYKTGNIKGHLQYKTNQNGKRYFGFCPNFDKEYTAFPIYDPSVDSKFSEDKRKESLMREFMKLHYYSKLINSDGTEIKKDFIDDEVRQKQGVDVILYKDQKKYIIDEKAQLDYIYKGPLETFALELLNSSSGNVGWFINDNLETEYYMFIWPHTDVNGRLVNVNNIEYARYALVEKIRLRKLIEERYQSADELSEYALRLSKGSLEGSTERYNRLYYNKPPFDKNAYLVYTRKPTKDNNGKKEEPVNLVVKNALIEEVAEDKGTLRRTDETNGGVML